MPTRLRTAAFIASLLPLGHMALTLPTLVEPVEFAIDRSGMVAVCFLCIALAVTPARRLLHWPALAGLRGMLGLFAFFYASVHGLAVTLAEGGNIRELWHIITLRPSNTLDAIAYLLLVPLALTSTRSAKRRLGRQAWTRLHRLAYLIAPMAVMRFWASAIEGRGYLPAIAFTLLLAILLGLRLYWRLSMRPLAQ